MLPLVLTGTMTFERLDQLLDRAELPLRLELNLISNFHVYQLQSFHYFVLHLIPSLLSTSKMQQP